MTCPRCRAGLPCQPVGWCQICQTRKPAEAHALLCAMCRAEANTQLAELMEGS